MVSGPTRRPVDRADRADSVDAPLCTDALWAGTLALMTRYAEPGSAALRPLIARKLVSNLDCLARHPDLARPLECVVRRAQDRWARLAAEAPHRH